MARIATDPNYSSPTFPRATAGTDLFLKEDVQALAAAVSTHDHSTGKGLALSSGSIPNGSITSAMIADGTIVAGDIADGTITSAKIADGTLVAADHADASLTNAKLASDTARANLLVNGGFEIWQRGNGPFTANTATTADRWLLAVGTPSTLSVARETVTVDAVFGSRASLKAVYGHSGAGTGYIQQQLLIGDGHQFNGRTMSASIRVNSSTAGAVRLRLSADGTGAPASNSTFNQTTGWETLQATLSVPTNATIVAVNVQLSDTASSTTTYIDNAMLVVGSVPADYAPLYPADDLARCLRYYERMDLQNGVAYVPAFVYGAGSAAFVYPYKVPKAATPTITFSGGPSNFSLLNAAAAPITTTGISSNDISIHRFQGQATVASGLVGGNASLLTVANPGASAIIIEANP